MENETLSDWLRIAAAEIEAVYPNASDDAKLAAAIALNNARNLYARLKRIELSLDQISTEIAGK